MRRALIAVAGIVVVAVAVVVTIVVTRTSNGGQPPALQASPGVYRLTPASSNLPELPTSIRTQAGTRYLTYGAVIDAGRSAQIWVADRQGDPHPVQITLTVGETKTANGVQLQLVHIWSMPDPSHDAIDVHATG